MTTKYERIIGQIKVCFVKDAETRLRVGVLINAALETGASVSRICDDIGISRTTAYNFSEAAAFWGDDRMAADKDGRAANFGHYSHVASAARQASSDAEADELKRRLVKGGMDAYNEWDHEALLAWRQDREVAEARCNANPHKPLFDALRDVRYRVSNMDDPEQPPLSSAERTKVRDIIRDIIACAAEAGVVVTPPARPLRRAS